MVPFDRNSRFVGRESQLSELEARLFKEGSSRKAAVMGLGGVGKTQIALELAYRTRDRHWDCSVFWILATSMENVEGAYLEIGRQLRIPGVENETADVKSEELAQQ